MQARNQGRKRHIVTNTQGNSVWFVVHEANIALASFRSRYFWLRHIFADGKADPPF
jgi:hypothetical protein